LFCALSTNFFFSAGKCMPARYFSTIAGLMCPDLPLLSVYCLLVPLPCPIPTRLAVVVSCLLVVFHLHNKNLT
jgi:hypothetical protein